MIVKNYGQDFSHAVSTTNDNVDYGNWVLPDTYSPMHEPPSTTVNTHLYVICL